RTGSAPRETSRRRSPGGRSCAGSTPSRRTAPPPELRRATPRRGWPGWHVAVGAESSTSRQCKKDGATLIGPPRRCRQSRLSSSSHREELLVDRVVRAVLPEGGQLGVDRFDEGLRAFLLGCEAVLLVGGVGGDDRRRLVVVGVVLVRDQVLENALHLARLERQEEVARVLEGHDLGVLGGVLLGVDLSGGAGLDCQALAGEVFQRPDAGVHQNEERLVAREVAVGEGDVL